MIPWKPLKIMDIVFFAFFNKSKGETIKCLHPYQCPCNIHFIYESLTPVAMVTRLSMF